MTDLHQIRIAFRSQPHVLQLDFLDLFKAKAAHTALTARGTFPEDGRVEVSDDAGAQIQIDRSDILFVMFSDQVKANEMQQIHAINQQVTQIRGSIALNTSPEVKAAQTAAGLAGAPGGMQVPQQVINGRRQ